MRRLKHAIIRDSAASSKRGFMMLMIAMMIAMMKSFRPENFMVMLQNLMMMNSMIIMTMIAITRNLVSESFMVMFQDLIMLMMTIMAMIMVINKIGDFMASTKVMKESVVTAIIQTNTGRLHTVSAI